jgi:hypothetical protein
VSPSYGDGAQSVEVSALSRSNAANSRSSRSDIGARGFGVLAVLIMLVTVGNAWAGQKPNATPVLIGTVKDALRRSHSLHDLRHATGERI